MPVVDSFNRTCNYGSKYSGSNIAGTMELPFCGLSVYYVERLLRRTCRDWSRESGESSSHGGGTVQLQPCGRSPQPPRGIWGMPPPPSEKFWILDLTRFWGQASEGLLWAFLTPLFNGTIFKLVCVVHACQWLIVLIEHVTMEVSIQGQT